MTLKQEKQNLEMKLKVMLKMEMEIIKDNLFFIKFCLIDTKMDFTKWTVE